MDATKYMIIAKGKFVTEQVRSYKRDLNSYRFEITFENNSVFPYAMNNVIFMSDPNVLNPNDYVIEANDGSRICGASAIYEFSNGQEKFWHIVFSGGYKDYRKNDLHIIRNCLKETRSSNVFEYLKEISNLCNVRLPDGEMISLRNQYERILSVAETSALSRYIDAKKPIMQHSIDGIIFPFGCNRSQYEAVRNALENQISVVQGPPGTGKTQTILNIISNLVMRDKTVLVVSNNNAATLNVLEKLSKDEYGMGFMVATLGNSENKKEFIENQTGAYPNLENWSVSINDRVSVKSVSDLAEKLLHAYQLKEEIAKLEEQQYAIEIEAKHFNEYASENGIDHVSSRIRRGLSSDKIMKLWQQLQYVVENEKSISIWDKLRNVFRFGILNWDFYEQEIGGTITQLQEFYYQKSLSEIAEHIKQKENELEQYQGNYESLLERDSLVLFKDYISRRYKWRGARSKFSLEDLYRNPSSVVHEYPIVLSTTFSARTSLNSDVLDFDYVIMDEASQVDIATGALALSCAKNAVIVGDLKQLPNIVENEKKEKAQAIRFKYDLGDAYDFAHKSFLQSIVDARPDAKSTLLREHYRCHPQIIAFCNRKFYNDELVVMTKDDNSGNALMAIKTVEGNHVRDNYNQRQIDVIKDEILPGLDVSNDEIGIIAPYNNQVDAIHKQLPGIDVATVHKFQGREKDVIILSTVDDIIKDFTDDPYLLNVAVSRAKKRLIVVTSGNKQSNNGNIVDLISYIQYNKMEVIDSQIYSVFDYLYSQYRDRRWEYLKKHRRVSQYDSENLTYAMLTEILNDYPEYDVACFTPLSMIVRDLSQLSEDEVRYATNPATHLDFIIFNKFSKQPKLAVETDGYVYHKEGTIQHDRDIKKNHILQVCGLPLVRLSTNGSNEKEKVLSALGF